MKKALIIIILVMGVTAWTYAQTPTPVCRAVPCSDQVTIGTSSTPIVGRLSGNLIVIVNISDEAIDLNVTGGAAVASKGIRLVANSGSYIIDNKGVPAGQRNNYMISGICASGNKKVTVTVY